MQLTQIFQNNVLFNLCLKIVQTLYLPQKIRPIPSKSIPKKVNAFSQILENNLLITQILEKLDVINNNVLIVG